MEVMRNSVMLLLVLAVIAVPVSTDNCFGLIFIGEQRQTLCTPFKNFMQFALNTADNYFVDPNGFTLRGYGDGPDSIWDPLEWMSQSQFNEFIGDNINLQCSGSVDIYYSAVLTDAYNFIQSSSYSSYGIFWAGSLDVITDASTAMPAAQQLATLNIPTFIWDYSPTVTDQALYKILTTPDRIFTAANPSLDDISSFFMNQAIPMFQGLSCGTPPTVLPSIQPRTSPAPTTMNPTTSTATPTPTGNTSCVGLELIFILDRSESMVPTIYNNNITAFVNAFVQGYTFPEETDGEHLGYIRLGVIQFSDTPDVTIPLANYSRSQFSNLVSNNVNIGDNSGVNNLKDALLAAYSQFQHNSTSKNRAIILVVDDVSTVSMDDSIDALAKLKSFVNLPMGAIVPGFSGTPAEGLAHLLILLGNDSTLAFPDLATAATAAPKLISKKYPCQLPPACSALVFIEEATTAIGADSKLSFLQLAAQLAAASSRRNSQRFGVSMFGTVNYNGLELQTFTEFNATVNAFIDVMASDNFPEYGVNYMEKALTQLVQVYNQGLVQNMTVIFIAETEGLKNPSAANTAAQQVAALGLNVYVLDASRFVIPGNLFKTLTGNLSGHILNATFTDPLQFVNVLTGTAVSEFNAMTC